MLYQLSYARVAAILALKKRLEGPPPQRGPSPL